jgi:hypothetical protein
MLRVGRLFVAATLHADPPTLSNYAWHEAARVRGLRTFSGARDLNMLAS